ncbi:MAG: alpha/beta hydrolase [Thermodesulfobacteriota bacterium]
MAGNEIHIRRVGEGEFTGLEVEPDSASTGWLFLLHGYGGSKEEMLSLSIFLAGKGIPVLAADLPGHGESGGLFDYESAMRCLTYWQGLKRNNFVAAIGHSIGGRLILSLDLSWNVLISPPLSTGFAGGKKEMIRVLRPRRVREAAPFAGLVETLNRLGEDLPADPDKKGLLLFGQYDLPVVKKTAEAAPPGKYTVKEIKDSGHHDILTSRETWGVIWSWLAEQVAHG